MKKVLYPLYFSFHCKAESCPRNCCSVFKIPFFRWEEKLFDSFPLWKDFNGTNSGIEECLIESDGIRYFPKSSDCVCAFLGDDSLCMLQKKYGQDVLPSVCRTYPRIITVYDDRVEYSLDPCCPEVVSCLKDWKVGEFIYENGEPGDDGRFLLRRRVFEILADESSDLPWAFKEIARMFGVEVPVLPDTLSCVQETFVRKVTALMVFSILFPHEGHPNVPNVMAFILDSVSEYLGSFKGRLPEDWELLSETFSAFLTDREIALRCEDEIEGRYRDINEKF